MRQIFFSILLFFAVTGYAEEFPQSGVLASHGSIAGMGLAIPQLPMGMTGEKVPLLGAVSWGEKGNWEMKIRNTHDKALKLTVKVIQYDGLKVELSSTTHNYKIKKGESIEESILRHKRAAACAVLLNGWKEM